MLYPGGDLARNLTSRMMEFRRCRENEVNLGLRRAAKDLTLLSRMGLLYLLDGVLQHQHLIEEAVDELKLIEEVRGQV